MHDKKREPKEICFDPFTAFSGRYLVIDEIGNIIEGFDTLISAEKAYPNLPLGCDYDDPG